MNWLAHVYLSEPDIEFRLGNLLADLVKGKQRLGMSEGFLRGVTRHQKIDAFTDSHIVMDRSRGRVGPDYRRYAGILCDIFMDYFLARDWNKFSPIPLQEFTAQFYAEIRAHPMQLPDEAAFAVERMIESDRLYTYRTMQGIEDSLHRVSTRIMERIGTDIHLEKAINELEQNEKGFEQDFNEFFPELQAYVAGLGS